MSDPENHQANTAFDDLMKAAVQRDAGNDHLVRGAELVDQGVAEGLSVEELRDGLRQLDGQPVDLGDQAQVNDAFVAMQFTSIGITRPTPQGRTFAKFAANARRLRNGEITREEFERIMRDEPGGPVYL